MHLRTAVTGSNVSCSFVVSAKIKRRLSQAELRRQLAVERKRTTKLEAAQTKLQSLYETRIVDLKALRTALSNREDQIKVLPGPLECGDLNVAEVFSAP